MTPEQLEEVPGIGEKTVEKISMAVRHYFGQYEEGEERPEPPAEASNTSTEETEDGAGGDGTGEAEETLTTDKLSGTTEERLAEEAAEFGEAQELNGVSAEDLIAAEDRASLSDANDDADAREEQIELRNDMIDDLAVQANETADEGIDTDGHDRG